MGATTIEIDAVVYDFGGVFMASPFEAIRIYGEQQGHEFEESLRIVFGSYDDDTDHPWHQCERGELDVVSARRQIRDLGRAEGKELDLFEMFKTLGAEMTGETGIDEGMVESVRAVRAAGCKTAILTNNIVEARELWRPLLPIDELFDVVVDSSEVGMRKPNPAIYRHTLEELGGVAPERAVFLDDYEGNVRAAQSIGMIGIVVDTDRSAAIDDLLALVRTP